MFAADVAHELKNPLTSLRSAVETLPLARNENSRSRLLAVIEHDVKRLDRLISDISDASRLDAELQRQDMTLGRSAPAVDRADVGRERNQARQQRRGRSPLRGSRPHRHLLGAGSRFAARTGDLQPAVQRAILFRARRQGAHRLSPRETPKSKSWSMTTGRAFARTRWSGFSSASTPTGRTRALGRIPDSDFRSPNRSSRPMAGASGRKTAAARSMPRASPASPARASWSGCPRHDAQEPQRARLGRAGGRSRRADPRPLRIAGKSRLAFDLILAGRAGQIPVAVLVGDDRVILDAAAGSCGSAPARRAGRPDRNPWARHPPAATSWPRRIVGLVVDLAAADAERLPPPEALRTHN